MLMVFFATRGIIILTCQVMFFILVRLIQIHLQSCLLLMNMIDLCCASSYCRHGQYHDYAQEYVPNYCQAVPRLTSVPVYAVSMLLTLTNRKTRGGTSGSGSSGSRGQHTRASEHVDLVALSFRTNAQPVHDPERGTGGDGRASPVVFASSKGPPEEVTMEPDPDDWDNSIGDHHHRRTSSSKVSLPSVPET